MTGGGILRPPILGSQNNDTSNSGASTSSIDLSALRNVITEIVRNENEQVISRLSQSNTRTTIDYDQGIDSEHMNKLDELDRIPDVVKSLREFSGRPGEFGSWKKGVERILKLYENTKGTPKYYGILSVIRNKITGPADTALESYNTPLNWEKISKCLTLHYADKRDLGTLEYQMNTLVQKNNSVHEFYHEVYYHLSLILNKLSSMEMSQESLDVMTRSYRDKALDTFVRGLKGDLPRLLSMREPGDLPQALHLCLKLENVQYRVQHSHGNIRNTQFPHPPPLPPKRHIMPQQRIPYPVNKNTFYPELLHNPHAPRPFPKHQFQKPFQNPPIPPRQFNNNNNFKSHFQKPEPMDVDRSIHSRQLNYQNRANLQAPAFKRPYSNQVHQPAKFQRIYHTEPNPEETFEEQIPDDPNLEEYEAAALSYEEPLEYPPQDYNEPETETLDDINFLD